MYLYFNHRWLVPLDDSCWTVRIPNRPQSWVFFHSCTERGQCSNELLDWCHCKTRKGKLPENLLVIPKSLLYNWESRIVIGLGLSLNFKKEIHRVLYESKQIDTNLF